VFVVVVVVTAPPLPAAATSAYFVLLLRFVAVVIVVLPAWWRCFRGTQVLLNDLRPQLPDVLGPALQELLQGMWRTVPAERPLLASVLDVLDGAHAAGAMAFFTRAAGASPFFTEEDDGRE
jgi:hypothetical protein